MRIYKLLITGAVFGLAVAAFPATARAQEGTLHKTGAAVQPAARRAATG